MFKIPQIQRAYRSPEIFQNQNNVVLYTYFQHEDELHFDDPIWVENKFKESSDGIQKNIQIVKGQV